MNIKPIRVIGTLCLTMMVSSCFYDPHYYNHPPYYSDGIYSPYDYYYYPSLSVYFQYSTGFYFYINDGIWIRSRVLPPRFRLSVHDRVIIHSKSDKPYLQNKTHIEKYRPRPRIKSSPNSDRYEREILQKTYKNQLERKSRVNTKKPNYDKVPPYIKESEVKKEKERRDKDKNRR